MNQLNYSHLSVEVLPDPFSIISNFFFKSRISLYISLFSALISLFSLRSSLLIRFRLYIKRNKFLILNNQTFINNFILVTINIFSGTCILSSLSEPAFVSFSSRDDILATKEHLSFSSLLITSSFSLVAASIL